jgi:hypothetical protein
MLPARKQIRKYISSDRLTQIRCIWTDTTSPVDMIREDFDQFGTFIPGTGIAFKGTFEDMDTKLEDMGYKRAY